MTRSTGRTLSLHHNTCNARVNLLGVCFLCALGGHVGAGHSRHHAGGTAISWQCCGGIPTPAEGAVLGRRYDTLIIIIIISMALMRAGEWNAAVTPGYQQHCYKHEV
jgi:hypothetical protein